MTAQTSSTTGMRVSKFSIDGAIDWTEFSGMSLADVANEDEAPDMKLGAIGPGGADSRSPRPQPLARESCRCSQHCVHYRHPGHREHPRPCPRHAPHTSSEHPTTGRVDTFALTVSRRSRRARSIETDLARPFHALAGIRAS